MTIPWSRLSELALVTLLVGACWGCRATTGEEDGGGWDEPDGGAPDAAIDAGPRQPLDILSWNVRDFPMTGASVQSVAQVIQDLDVEVIGLQEIAETTAFVDLIQALPGYDGVIADDPNAYLRVGLVYRTERIELVHHDTIFRDDWYAFPRPPLVATLEVLDPSGSVAFDFIAVVVHQKASLDAESQERRLLGCERLEGWMASRIELGEEEDIVVMGDWNDELTDSWSYNVFVPFLEQPERYTFLTLPLAEDGAYSYIPFRSFLDHILVSASALEEYGAGQTTVLPLESEVAGYQTNISDHRPVRASFALP